jgi:hypothetical protein
LTSGPGQARSITGRFGTSKSWSASPMIPGIEESGLTTGRSVPDSDRI